MNIFINEGTKRLIISGLLVLSAMQLSGCSNLQQELSEVRKANQIIQMDNALWEYGSKYEGRDSLSPADRASLVAIAVDAEEEVKQYANDAHDAKNVEVSTMAISYLRIALTAQELLTRNQLNNTQVTALVNAHQNLCKAQIQSAILQRDCFFVQTAPLMSMIGKMAYAANQGQTGFSALVPGALAYQSPGRDIADNPALKQSFDFWVERTLRLTDLVLAMDCEASDMANNESLQHWCIDIQSNSSQYLGSWLQDIFQILENTSDVSAIKTVVAQKQNALDTKMAGN